MSDTGNRITFFFSGGRAERAALEPIAAEAECRGYVTEFTTEVTDPTAVGVYNTHVYPDETVNAERSVVLMNSVDDGYDPEYFWRERWNRFDIGLLSGQAVAEYWQSVSKNTYGCPRHGVYAVGWPKADWVHSEAFADRIDELRDEIDLPEGSTAVYAPAEESAGKMEDFLAAADGAVDTMLIKHKEDVNYSTDKLQSFESELIILDNTLDIFEALALGDILVTEQSSVIPEALHTNTHPISVTDWPVTFSSGTRYPGDTLPDFVTMTTKTDLRSTIDRILTGDLSLDFEAVRQRHFANPGESAGVSMDVIEEVLLAEGDHSSRVPRTNQFPGSAKDLFYAYARVNAEKRLSPTMKKCLMNLGVSRLLMKLDRLFLNR